MIFFSLFSQIFFEYFIFLLFYQYKVRYENRWMLCFETHKFLKHILHRNSPQQCIVQQFHQQKDIGKKHNSLGKSEKQFSIFIESCISLKIMTTYNMILHEQTHFSYQLIFYNDLNIYKIGTIQIRKITIIMWAHGLCCSKPWNLR